MSWLFAWIFWTGCSAGALAWLAIHHLTLGRWGEGWRRLAGAAARGLPLMLLAGGLWAGQVDQLYAWQHFPPHRRVLYAAGPVLSRSLLALLVWSVLAFWLSGSRRRQGPAAFCLLSLLSLGSLLAFDLVMSLDPEFYSSLFGLIVLLGWSLSALCLLVLLSPADDPERLHDWGGLLLCCLMLQAYVDFSQLLIVWSGNLPEEGGWLLLRVWGAWQPLAALLFLGFGALPFLLLLAGPLKRRAAFLRPLAAWLLVGCGLHLYWLMWPCWSREFRLEPTALLSWLVLGAGWLASFAFWRSRLGQLRAE
ncbi:MAG: hypothetical protein U0931_15460 [Vulcanimicrobiota bacterium]